MADREFTEYEGTGSDQDGEDVTSTVRAHVVTKDTAGEVTTRTGNQNVSVGQVLVETDRPGVYDVLSADEWDSTDYSDGNTTQNARGKRAAAKTRKIADTKTPQE
jgi:hypothetical protein